MILLASFAPRQEKKFSRPVGGSEKSALAAFGKKGAAVGRA